MGKKRITELLAQLETNQQRDLQNASAIFTVAQVAVDELRNQAPETPALPAASPLLPTPVPLNKAELLRRYGSYNGCRQAAKAEGIRFKGSPSWDRLIAAFSYIESLRQLVHAYVEHYPSSDLQGVSFELSLE